MRKYSRKNTRGNLAKGLIYLAIAGLCFYVDFAFADGTSSKTGLGLIATNIQDSFTPIAKLITGCSFVAGLGFAFASILKFKAHKDNPTQIPVGTPIALLLVACCLLFLPFLFKQAATTMFGTTASFGVGGTSSLSGKTTGGGG